MYRHKRSASGGFPLVILRDSVAFWNSANTNWLVFEFWLVAALWPTLFHGTCKYLALVGPWTLMIIGSLCLFHRVHNLLLQLSRPNFPVRWTVFCFRPQCVTSTVYRPLPALPFSDYPDSVVSCCLLCTPARQYQLTVTCLHRREEMKIENW